MSVPPFNLKDWETLTNLG